MADSSTKILIDGTIPVRDADGIIVIDLHPNHDRGYRIGITDN
jgi:hypothetical protein